MARGWESKSVEIQIEDSAGSEEPETSRAPRVEPIDLRCKREGLVLQRSRILQEIETARNPRYQNMLAEILNHVERELAGLNDK